MRLLAGPALCRLAALVARIVTAVQAICEVLSAGVASERSNCSRMIHSVASGFLRSCSRIRIDSKYFKMFEINNLRLFPVMDYNKITRVAWRVRQEGNRVSETLTNNRAGPWGH